MLVCRFHTYYVSLKYHLEVALLSCVFLVLGPLYASALFYAYNTNSLVKQLSQRTLYWAPQYRLPLHHARRVGKRTVFDDGIPRALDLSLRCVFGRSNLGIPAFLKCTQFITNFSLPKTRTTNSNKTIIQILSRPYQRQIGFSLPLIFIYFICFQYPLGFLNCPPEVLKWVKDTTFWFPSVTIVSPIHTSLGFAISNSSLNSIERLSGYRPWIRGLPNSDGHPQSRPWTARCFNAVVLSGGLRLRKCSLARWRVRPINTSSHEWMNHSLIKQKAKRLAEIDTFCLIEIKSTYSCAIFYAEVTLVSIYLPWYKILQVYQVRLRNPPLFLLAM